MKKILIINTTRFGYNGITSVLINYYVYLNKKKFSIDFIALNEVDKKTKDILLNSEIYELPHRRWNPIKFYKEFFKILNNRYDVVHVNGNSATMGVDLFLALYKKIPVRIAHCHNSTCDHRILHKILLPIFNKTYTHALACSKEAGDWIFKKNNFDVLRNAIDSEKYLYCEENSNKLREKFKLKDSFVIGHVGLFNEQKNHTKLFEIFSFISAHFKNAKLILISGNREVPNHIYDCINKMGIKEDVEFYLQRDDVNELMMLMDLFIFPSKWEGLGLGLIEAQACGLPCVTSTAVPQEANVSNNVLYLDLAESSFQWYEKSMKFYNGLSLQSREMRSLNNRRLIIEKGYDLKTEVKYLSKLYGESI